MSKLFFDYLIESAEIEVLVKKTAKSEEERHEMWHLIDEIIHHRVFDVILTNLHEAHHHEFLELFHQHPHDEKVMDYLKSKIGDNIEELIRGEMGDLASEILFDVDMKEKGGVLVIILSIIAVLALTAAAFFYGQNLKLKEPVGNATAIPLPTSTAQAISPLPVMTSLPKVTVVFEAEGSFTQVEKDEIQKKVIDPFLDYYAEPGNSAQKLLTFTIAKNDKASKDQYPYSAQAIFDGGGNMGFLIMKVGTGIDWWYPECLNGCNLSAAFKAKYPEIAAKVQ